MNEEDRERERKLARARREMVAVLVGFESMNTNMLME